MEEIAGALGLDLPDLFIFKDRETGVTRPSSGCSLSFAASRPKTSTW
jgi:hypothetical protein